MLEEKALLGALLLSGCVLHMLGKVLHVPLLHKTPAGTGSRTATVIVQSSRAGGLSPAVHMEKAELPWILPHFCKIQKLRMGSEEWEVRQGK